MPVTSISTKLAMVIDDQLIEITENLILDVYIYLNFDNG